MKQQACRTCNLITTAKLCPNCKTFNPADDWVGEVFIFDPEQSAVAKLISVTRPGRYALRVR